MTARPVDMLLHIARTALLRGEYSLSLDACAAVAPYLNAPLAAKPALGGQRNGEADRHDYATN